MKTHRLFTPFAFRTITLAALLLTTITLTAGIPFFYDRPSDKAIITWLSGKKVTIEKGIIFDDTWTIKAKEFKEIEKLSISKDKHGVYTMHLRFDLASGQRELRVYAVMRYQMDDRERAVLFLSCESERLVKLGRW